MSSFSTAIKKQWRLITFILVLVLIFLVFWTLRSVLIPFAFGFIFAYMLLPVVRWLEKHLPVINKKRKFSKFLRVITILILYLLVLVIIGLLVFYTVNIVRESLSTISVDASEIIPNALDNIRDWLKSLPFLSSEASQEAIDNYINRASEALPEVIVDFLTRGVRIIQTSANTILGFIILPVFMFFILKDWERLRDKFYAALPPWPRKHTKGVFDILQEVIIRYVRGQVFLGLVVGILTYFMLLILRIKFAVPLAIFSAATELVPMVGPWIGGGLGVLVTLAVAPDKVIWVAIGYVVIQLLENQLLVPRIQGTQMEINPAFVIVLTILGAYFAGILGFIVILPATMAVIRLFRYFRDNAVDERLSIGPPSDL